MHFKPKQIINISFTGLIVLLALPASAVLATWNSQPDDTLYPIKRGLEKTALAITPQSLIKAKLQFAFLERRTQEASIALVQNPNQKEVLSQIIAQAQVAQASTTLKSKDQQITASLELIEQVYQTTEELDQVKSTISDLPTGTQAPPLTPNSTTPTQNPPITQTEPAPQIIPSPSAALPTQPSPVIVQPTANPPAAQAITQTQEQLTQIASQVEQQLETQDLSQEQQKQFETIKRKEKKPKLKKPKPISDEEVEKYKDTQCWNKAWMYKDHFTWSNGCRGHLTNDLCTQALVKLSNEEVEKYNQWVSNGKPDIPGCH